MLRFRDEMKVKLLADVKMSQQELSGENHIVVEGIIPMGSNLIGKSLMELNFKKIKPRNFDAVFYLNNSILFNITSASR